ncbi:MAG TPA: hypothetical protein VII56_19940 [Rhizomicrobium sp.]
MLMGRTLTLAAAICAAVLLQTLPSLAGADDAIVVYGPVVPPKGCSVHRAHPVRLMSFASHSERYLGKCLRLSGLLIGRTLFTGIDGYYRRGSYESDSFLKGEERFHIGLYASSVLLEKFQNSQAFRATVIGIASTCEQLNGPTVIMVLGACHFTSGAILAVATARTRPTVLVRLTGERARQRVGNMQAAPTDWPERATIAAFASRWLNDIQSGNVADYKVVNGGASYLDTSSYVFTDIPSAFESFRGKHSQPQLEIFLTRENPPFYPDELHRVAISCFCRKADCTGLWPISTMDAANAPQRPYVCMSVYREKGRDTAETDADERQIEESSTH